MYFRFGIVYEQPFFKGVLCDVYLIQEMMQNKIFLVKKTQKKKISLSLSARLKYSCKHSTNTPAPHISHLLFPRNPPNTAAILVVEAPWHSRSSTKKKTERTFSQARPPIVSLGTRQPTPNLVLSVVHPPRSRGMSPSLLQPMNGLDFLCRCEVRSHDTPLRV